MGFDIKAALDGIVAFATQYYPFILAGLALFLLFSSNRIRHGIEKALTENWQLTLLASTGIALSLASAYTTFDGLRNFTSAPLLSVFISFGIQGVMLIVAWLIGESFAVGMNQRNSEGKRVRLVDASVGMLLGVAFVGLVFYWTLQQANAVSLTSNGAIKADMGRFADVAMYFLLALVLVAMLAFGFRRGGDISTPYVQSLRLIVKNAVLWVMFLASMAASVFFSFDSHFNAIFPSESRKRAAEIRTTGQVGGVIADIGALTQKRQIEEAERLFDTEGWKAYDRQLSSLAQTAQGAQGEIEKYFVQRMEERRRAIAQQQERIATAQSGQAGLAGKKVSLTEELSRLKAERPALAAEYGQHQAELDAKAKEIDAKRVEGMAEDRGVEGTLKQGKGPVYRQRMTELAGLQDQFKIKQERTNDARKRLVAVETRIAQIARELSTIDGDLAKLKGEAQTAEQRIKAAEAVSADDDAGKVDPARVLPAFERARAAFRQQPDTERLGALQLQCTQLATAMLNAPAVKESVRGIDCDPKSAAEAAARVFALNTGIAAFQANCAGGDKLAKLSTTDGLLAFGRKCLQDSGLISKDSADVGARLAGIDMNRDDKAHRFVVTWNAFLDGNRLAYLSLVLAIGVDALVFMSGLFGAQALRSPLSDVPSPKARSAEQLQAVIDTALLPHTYDNARIVLNAMRAMTPRDGYTQWISIRDDDPHAPDLHRVLNAGATIGAVRHAEGNVYELRAELFEYLSLVAKKAFVADKNHVALADLERIVTVALVPDVKVNVETVLQYVHPIEDRPTFLERVGLRSPHDFTAEIRLDDVFNEEHKRIVRGALNAGASAEAVQRADNNHYFISRDFYRTLARIRARFLITTGHTALQAASSQPVPLGSRESPRMAIASRPEQDAQPQLSHQPQRHPKNIEADLIQMFWDELLAAIDLTMASVARVLQPAVSQQADMAWQALSQRAHNNYRLETFLREAEEEKRLLIDRKYSELRGNLENDPEALSALDGVVADVQERLKAMLLLPDIGVVQDLIERLEDAVRNDGGPSPDDEELYRLLREVQSAIEGIDRSQPESWKYVAQVIQGRVSESSNHGLREIDPANKRPI